MLCIVLPGSHFFMEARSVGVYVHALRAVANTWSTPSLDEFEPDIPDAIVWT